MDLTVALPAPPLPLQQRQCWAFPWELDQGWVGNAGASRVQFGDATVLYKLIMNGSLAVWTLLCVNTAWTSRGVVPWDSGSMCPQWVFFSGFLYCRASTTNVIIQCLITWAVHYSSIVSAWYEKSSEIAWCIFIPRDLLIKLGAWSGREMVKLLLLHFSPPWGRLQFSRCVSRSSLWSDKLHLAGVLAAKEDIMFVSQHWLKEPLLANGVCNMRDHAGGFTS